ncbi:MAG TPA: ribonuclease H-like domain-containing protein [Patescibacteria group bacterium]|jgi:DEAD/DEAH box helicase domain-containing protein|nr:ribonuclease H-like domain-containing protein [Patescibacteria group bacterium]
MLKKLVLDLETQKSFEDVGGRGKNHLLKVSVCGIYDYSTDQYSIYEEHELPRLGSLLQSADQVIGFNIKNFDFAVLQPYLNFDLSKVPYYDLLEEIEKVIGHRIKLESVAQGTLGSGKSGNGLEAILYYRNGRMDLLKKYCLDDVRVTKQVYDYALKNQKLMYRDYFNVREFLLACREPLTRSGVMRQEVLF